MDVYHADPSDISDAIILLRGDEAHHMLRVARHGVGDIVHLTDGEGAMHRARIRSVTRNEAECEILESFFEWNEPSMRVSVAAAMLRNPGRMDWLVEKCTELGASSFIPLNTERTIARGGKSARWRQLAFAAMKQCGRSRLPVVTEPAALTDLPELAAGTLLCVLHEGAPVQNTPEALLAEEGRPDALVLAVGPEGGFSDAEIRCLSDAGARILSLGMRRLRSETAAMAALARLLA